MAGRLEGKMALITGAARGQGEAEARLFVAEGARVVFGDVRHELGTKVAASLGDAGLGAYYCLGSHLARMETRIAVSALLDRLPNLRLDPAASSRMVGFAFRSPDRLPVLFG